MHALLHALSITGSMTWEITWALILGFLLSAVVQAVVRKSTVIRLLGDDRPRTLAIASALGAASSSCSYAAVALARSLFRKGADFTAAMAFEIASTNLVVELGVILALLMGWQFTAAEFVGGPIMIIALAVLFRLFLRDKLLREAREQADRGLAGSMEGHAAMDMSVQGEGSFTRRLFSRDGFTATAHVFVMEWAAILKDLVIGLLVAGAIAAWVPDSFWQAFFFAHHPLAAKLWGPLIGPVVAMISFVCSIGNVPLAVVLWKGGISFGGVVAFIFADLLILPILNIYRKYYGRRMAYFLLATFYAAMVLAGYLVELLFGGLGLIPDQRDATIPMEGISWNYTSWLNIAFLLLAAVLVIRFFRTGGMAMMHMMGGGPDDHAGHGHEGHEGHAGHGGHAGHAGHDGHDAHEGHGGHEGHGDHSAHAGHDHGAHGDHGDHQHH
ncbi:permease [Kitasatospora acidiphila]|uniref:Permease n=1 Tax=Kitasatospora acidiphila TaxID=2567942 RepID=A0A540W6Z7_9ACTN|nr:permease [Kitasatospora acidiphila]TQF04114.1 permease [Kitasatospora acidiphila]